MRSSRVGDRSAIPGAEDSTTTRWRMSLKQGGYVAKVGAEVPRSSVDAGMAFGFVGEIPHNFGGKRKHSGSLGKLCLDFELAL